MTAANKARGAAVGLLLSLSLAAAASCGPRIPPGRVDSGPATTLTVDNQGFLDVNVYALRSGTRMRLGTVSGLTTRTFVLPSTVVGNGIGVRFIADFIGSSRAPVSEEIVIWAGDEIGIRIPPA